MGLRGTTACLALGGGLCLSVLLGGCEAFRQQPAPAPGPDSAMLEIDRVIATALKQASDANMQVAGAEAAVIAPERAGPGQEVPPGVRLPPEVTQAVDIDWQGPVEPLLEALADRAQYEFRVVGVAPATPVMVNIVRERTPLVEILRESGIVIHEHGDVALSLAARRIELRYGP